MVLEGFHAIFKGSANGLGGFTVSENSGGVVMMLEGVVAVLEGFKG